MQISLNGAGDSCVLKSKTDSSSNVFTIPISTTDLISGLRDLLKKPETKEVEVGSVRIVGQRDWIAVHSGAGAAFQIPYRHVLALVLEA